jgi:hypothetical protein
MRNLGKWNLGSGYRILDRWTGSPAGRVRNLGVRMHGAGARTKAAVALAAQRDATATSAYTAHAVKNPILTASWALLGDLVPLA